MKNYPVCNELRNSKWKVHVLQLRKLTILLTWSSFFPEFVSIYISKVFKYYFVRYQYSLAVTLKIHISLNELASSKCFLKGNREAIYKNAIIVNFHLTT